ncbi:hypothetical protein [Kingella potus]|uniref:hypothetical protein n=1 Tax=Kingella potus TaxID=265175 RepID=UPI001FD36ED8|nr:hypothetical protein [Kingella potus]UOP00709.1 hypothetical protein LVJ84_13095 [Kingella potus]
MRPSENQVSVFRRPQTPQNTFLPPRRRTCPRRREFLVGKMKHPWFPARKCKTEKDPLPARAA